MGSNLITIVLVILKILSVFYLTMFAVSCSVKIANMLCGSRSINQKYSTTEYFDYIGLVKESFSQDVLKDPILCMHFSGDDKDDSRWDSFHMTKEALKSGTVQHQKTWKEEGVKTKHV